MESISVQENRRKNPRAQANPFSALTFGWTIPTFIQGMKKEMILNDLPEPLREHKSANLGDKLEREWDIELNQFVRTGKNPSLIKAIFKVFRGKLIMYGVLLATSHLVVLIAQPLLLGGLISYFTPGSNLSKNEAYMYAAGLMLCSIVSALLEHPYFLGIMHLCMKLRIAVCSLIYRKTLRINKISLNKTTSGHVINLMSNDASRFDVVFTLINMIWIAPIQTIILSYLMWRLVGLSSLIGIAVLLIFIPIQGALGKQISNLRLKIASRTDYRISLMNEIITGIQAIKMYAWEIPFANMVATARRKEIQQITYGSYIRGILMSFILFHSRTAMFANILSYVLLGNHITAEKVFVLSSFYNLLRISMTQYLPQTVTDIAECSVSVERIRKYLLLEIPEGNENGGLQQSENIEPSYLNKINVENNCLTVNNITAKWSEESEDILQSLSLVSKSGQLTVIVGTVGSGKTSFFHALLNELKLTRGTVEIMGVVSYASQEPWLFQGSVKQNILFGETFDKERYIKTVKVCALRPDFDQFPYEDNTIVGERGIVLSGGQKARVNLARAIYKKADIYLLDDPLSAVDPHVGKHLFEDCIKGYLHDKIVILTTHQLQYLEKEDQIMVLENGTVKAKGTLLELQKSGQDVSKMVTSDENHDQEQHKGRMRLNSQMSYQSNGSLHDEFTKPENVQETHVIGKLGSYVYIKYINAGGGWCIGAFVLILFILSQAFASGDDFWLTYWVNLEEHVYTNPPEGYKYIFVAPRSICISVFGALTLATIIAVFLRSYMFFNMCMRASRNLHRNMFDSISRATMHFFTNNPSGRILNRFSKDIGIIDELLPITKIDIIEILFTVLAVVIVVTIVNPWLLIPAGVCALLFYFLRIPYICTSRNIKRLEGISRSPVFTHLNASLQGLTTIRALKAQKLLINEFDNHQDLNTSAYYLYLATTRAFGFWLDLVCIAYLGVVTFSFLVLPGDTYGGDVGLAITQSIGLTGMLQWGIRQLSEMENQMTSVERVLEYSSIRSEPALQSDKKPKSEWPHKGEIEFKNVHLRYSLTDPWVLKQLTFSIRSEQKIGIVGRTGAGKSSLISALFRLTEIEGLIEIDGIDLSTIGLHDLRSKISVIPQEPFLFSSSLRQNLDPFDEYNDDILWQALCDVELRETVKDLPNGLSSQLFVGGSNLSVGQRQLICLARAIIKKNKILILDEATANVDRKTDALIQETIRKKFASCTILTIAHRINTVMDSDKLLVMDSGHLAEFDHPHILLTNPSGVFYNMVEQSGKLTRDNLHGIAAESFRKKIKDD